MKTKKLFCFGYGYSCDYLGHDLARDGDWQLAGTTRDPEKCESLRSRSIQAGIFNYEEPLTNPQDSLKGTTHLVISTPPGDDGDPAFLMHAEDILNTDTLEWVGYLSTTGVYGDRGGRKVDETSELRPTTKRGQRRLQAEQQWLSLYKNHGLPVHIFRLAGIYGPGRSALDSIRAGVARRIYKEGHAFGRIHVEDITNILITSMNNPAPGNAYNVCDNEPAPSHEVIEYACKLMGRPPPPLIPIEEANLAPITMSFYTDNRRTQNDKIKDKLNVKLKYPNYREGLKACMEAEDYAATKLFKI